MFVLSKLPQQINSCFEKVSALDNYLFSRRCCPVEVLFWNGNYSEKVAAVEKLFENFLEWLELTKGEEIRFVSFTSYCLYKFLKLYISKTKKLPKYLLFIVNISGGLALLNLLFGSFHSTSQYFWFKRSLLTW